MSDKKKKLLVFSGAGVSAESGLKTFRDQGGLWEDYDIQKWQHLKHGKQTVI